MRDPVTNFCRRYFPGIKQAVMIRTEDKDIGQRIRSLFITGQDMGDIARCFIPSTQHTASPQESFQPSVSRGSIRTLQSFITRPQMWIFTASRSTGLCTTRHTTIRLLTGTPGGKDRVTSWADFLHSRLRRARPPYRWIPFLPGALAAVRTESFARDIAPIAAHDRATYFTRFLTSFGCVDTGTRTETEFSCARGRQRQLLVTLLTLNLHLFVYPFYCLILAQEQMKGKVSQVV